MDIINFIEKGAVKNNPNYKKGSKNPLTASPYVISNNPTDAVTPADIAAQKMLDKTYGLTHFDMKANKYDKYGVTVNPNVTEEELNLQRAKNQSGIEQTINSLGQILENEVVLGTLLGISNLVDWTANLIKKEPNDFTNPVSQFFEELQEKNRERLAIYQENPDKSWQVGDWGWWMNNLVSVGSTVSLMIPSMGVSKGLSWIGKATKLNKGFLNTAKAVANVGNRVQKGKKLLFRPHSFVNEASNWIEASTAALASRIGEGYMEARDTYNTVYDEALKELSTMSNEEKADLIERNPNYATMSDEDIAKDLASISGANTFAEDMPLFFLDLLQYKSLNNLFKNNIKNGNVTAKTRLEHKNTMRKLAGVEEESITNLKLMKESFMYGIKNPTEIIKSIPFTEGLEEGWQGIVQDRSQELYRMAMDPTINTKTIGSYLKDGHIWEQAFWGIVGGAVFQGVGNIASNFKSEIDRVKENKRLSKQNQKEKLTSQKARENEINSRFTKMNTLIERMEHLNKGEHYSEFEVDEKGKPVIDADGLTSYKKLSEEEVFQEKEKLINDFVDELVMESIDNGTYELTKEFIESEYFDKYFTNKNMNKSDVDLYIKDRVQSRLESTRDLYLKNLDILTTVIDNPYYHSLQAAARDLTRRDISIEAHDDYIRSIDEKLQNLNETDRLSDGSYDRELVNVIRRNLEILDSKETQLRKDYQDKKISKAALDASIEEINSSRNKFYKNLEGIKSELADIKALKDKVYALKANKNLNEANAEYNQILNEIVDILYKDDFDILTNTTKDLLKRRAVSAIKKEIDLMNLPVGEEAIKDFYSNIDYGITEYAYNKMLKAYNLVKDYLEKSENPNEAFNNLMESNDTLSKELKDSLEILKLSSKNGTIHYQKLVDIRDKAIRKLEKERIEEEKVKVNGDEVTATAAEEVKAEVEKVIDDVESADNSSTGEEEEAFIKDFIETAADNYFDDVTYGVDLIFNDFITKHVNAKQYIEIIKNIKEISFDDANYKKIYETLADELMKEHGLDERTANTIVKEQISSILGMIAIQNSTNPTLKQKYSILSKQLRYGVKFVNSGEKLSATSIIEDIEEKYKLIDEIIKLYIENTNSPKNVLDVDKFFEHLLENEELDYASISTIFEYFTDYLLDRRIHTANSYVFDNFRNNPNDFFNKLREVKAQRETVADYMHIRATRKKHDNYEMALAAAKRGEKVYLRQSPDHTEIIQIMCMGVELGILTKVKATNDTNTRYKNTIKARGLYWEVSKTDAGYESNYDEFFNALFDKNDKNAQALLELLTSEDVYSDIEYLKAAIADVKGGNVVLEEIERQSKKGRTTIPAIVNEILSVINYTRESDTYYSYQGWLKKVYDNYAQTKRLQDILNENKENTVILNFKNIGIQTPHYTKENVDVSGQPFVEEINTVIAVDKNGQIITEKGNERFNSATIFNTGTMGLLLTNANGNPIIARFAEANGVTKGSKLYKALYNYLTDIFTQYQTNENYTINNLYEDLLEILVLRKDKNDTEFNPLFSGYTLIKIKGGIAIAKSLPYGQKEGKTPFILAVYDKKYTKTGYEGEGGNTRSYTLFNEEGKPYANVIDGNRVSFAIHNPQYIHGMVTDIIAGLKFNRSMTFLNNKNESNVKTNKHFYKENGKLYVEFGDVKLEYNSYFQFIMENNAFKVNVENKNGSFTYNSSESNDFYINVAQIEPGKSPYELINPKAKVDEAVDLIETASTEVPVSTLEVLELIGANVEKYKPWIANGVFSDAIYYDSNPEHNGHASTKNEKIIFTKKGTNLLRRHPEEIVRLLAHEEFHIKLAQANVFERESIINDLLDTYNQFVKAVEERAANGDREAKALKHWIEKNNFKPDNQFNKNDVGNREFVEEWLVESITNQPIIQFLNKVEYEGTIQKQEKKSILQHIIELIFNLFGISFDNVNKSSILARQISLLNDTNLVTPNNITTNEKGETNVNSPVEEEPSEEPTPDKLEPNTDIQGDEDGDLVEYEEDEEDELLSATIPFVELEQNQTYLEKALNDFADNPNNNPHGFIKVEDMEDFIQSYPPQFRGKIRTLLDTGAIKFICR